MSGGSGAATRGRPGATYLFGGRDERTNVAVVRAIGAALDALRPQHAPHARIAYVVDRPGHDHRYAIDPTSAERGLGWNATMPFESGITETVGWYLANREWAAAIREQRYRGERLGGPAA